MQIDLNDPRYAQKPRVFSTVIIKRKSIDLYKARLCTRGDLVPLPDVAFVSSPTAHRVCIRLLITLSTIFRWQLKTLDISQAVLQSSNLNDSDRLVIIPPPRITLPWKSEPPPEHIGLKLLRRSRLGFLLVRPLYGGRDAPMRWFITFSTILREAGYRQLKTDVCLFTRTLKEGKIDGVFAAHVDDILFTGSPSFLRGAERIITAFRAGDAETLQPGKPVISLGLKLEIDLNHISSLSQRHYVAELSKIDTNEYVKQGAIIDKADHRTTLRQALGALIWVHQTRPDIGFNITKIATDAVDACLDADLATEIILLRNKTIRFLGNFPRAIRYVPLFSSTETCLSPWGELGKMRSVAFSDAGFGSLKVSRSI